MFILLMSSVEAAPRRHYYTRNGCTINAPRSLTDYRGRLRTEGKFPLRRNVNHCNIRIIVIVRR